MRTRHTVRILVGSLAVILLATAAACSSDKSSTASTDTTPKQSTTSSAAPDTQASKTIVDLAVATPDLSTLVAAVKAAGLVETLSGKGPYTVFAPTNEAFAALPAGTLDELLKPENKDQLVKVLTYHVVPGTVTSSQLVAGPVTTVEGQDVTIALAGGKAMVNDATVVTADIAASNGVVHVIDKVLLPPTT